MDLNTLFLLICGYIMFGITSLKFIRVPYSKYYYNQWMGKFKFWHMQLVKKLERSENFTFRILL